MCNIEKKDYSEMTYAEFCSAIDNDDNLSLLFGTAEEDGWQIWKDEESNRFFYIECGINDASDFFEVVSVARLYYDDVDCVSEKHDVETLVDMFDAEICGDQILDDKIIIWWFNRKEDVRAEDIVYAEIVDIHPRKDDNDEE